jgi:hypothetical protein
LFLCECAYKEIESGGKMPKLNKRPRNMVNTMTAQCLCNCMPCDSSSCNLCICYPGDLVNANEDSVLNSKYNYPRDGQLNARH